MSERCKTVAMRFGSLLGVLLGTTVIAGGALAAEVAQSTAEPAAPTSMSAAPEADDATSDEILVRGTRYNPSVIDSATKMPLSVLETPQSISFVTRELIEDLGTQRLDEVTERIAGSTRAGNFGGYYKPVLIRGFFASNLQGNKIDGATFIKLYEPDVSSVERIEVVKGPSSVLYGRTVPGGFINLVSKKPLEAFAGRGDIKIGSYDFYRGEVDLGGPLAADGAVRFRLTGAVQDTGSHIDFVDGSQQAANLFVTIDATPTTQIDVKGFIHDQEGLPYWGIGVRFDNTLPDVPKSFLTGAPFARYDNEANGAGVDVYQGINDNLRAVVRANWNHTSRDTPNGVLPFDPVQANGDVEYWSYREDQDWNVYNGEFNLIGNFDLFGQTSDIIVGADITRIKLRNGSARAAFNANVNIFTQDFSVLRDITLPILAQQQFRYNYKGVFAQAVLRPVERLSVMLGGRVDWVEESIRTPTSFTKTDDRVSTGRVGLLYELENGVSVYGSYTESFEPSIGGRLQSGAPVPPSRARQYEIGAKAALFDGGAIASFAIFDLEKSNIAEGIPGTVFRDIVGTQTHRGIELELVGEVAPGLNLIGAATYLDAEISRSLNAAVRGNRPEDVPEWVLSAFATYQVQSGALEGFGGGGGVLYVDRRFGDNPNSFQLPAYTRYDALLFYRGFEKVELQLNVQNLTDKRYYDGAAGGRDFGNNYGAPRTILGTVRFKF